MQPFVRIAGLILMRAIRDCIPLKRTSPIQFHRNHNQNYSLSPTTIIPLSTILFFSPQLAMLT